MIEDLQYSPFFYFISIGAIKEIMICIKLGCDLKVVQDFGDEL